MCDMRPVVTFQCDACRQGFSVSQGKITPGILVSGFSDDSCAKWDVCPECLLSILRELARRGLVASLFDIAESDIKARGHK